jgi:hypothetical protein
MSSARSASFSFALMHIAGSPVLHGCKSNIIPAIDLSKMTGLFSASQTP